MSTASQTSQHLYGLRLAIAQAERGKQEGGIPIGSALVGLANPLVSEIPPPTVYGSGHNQRLQKSSAILHAEMAALEDAGRLTPDVYRETTMYTTLSPCSMCTGAILLYGIPRVVIGENTNFKGDEELLRSRGVEVIILENDDCKNMMAAFIRDHPEQWDEDIGRRH